MRRKGKLTKEQLEKSKCADSPTGAHHWRINGSGLGQCKYCGEERRFCITWPLPNSKYNRGDAVIIPRSAVTPFGKMRDHRW